MPTLPGWWRCARFINPADFERSDGRNQRRSPSSRSESCKTLRAVWSYWWYKYWGVCADVPSSQTNADFYSLIAIMLGRLEMTVAECIAAYTNMFKRIFEKHKQKSPINFWGRLGKLQGRFNSKILENSIEEIVKNRGLIWRGSFKYRWYSSMPSARQHTQDDSNNVLKAWQFCMRSSCWKHDHSLPSRLRLTWRI